MPNERRVMLIQPFCLFVVFFSCALRRESLDRFNTATSRQGEKKQQGFCKKNNTIQQYGDSNKKKKKNTFVQWMACVCECVCWDS